MGATFKHTKKVFTTHFTFKQIFNLQHISWNTLICVFKSEKFSTFNPSF
jgi:hypothetical protein